ncbi:hypothetical protein D8B26_004578 [Coccidioides posadasii str. Silveira]|uniref:FAD dependent oxidoreductase domain-containing protein n=2 Tax=Coccidioides posadasii TaxID=199306 RepID=E9DEK0_COCPS|nr:FAD dependent oxidoreductase family protein [Coccidioides posadasii C735 delta SOWgp]EER28259.1 FAD dependent oxidoreductase family protein [Coccidioides posadasii C735 delta SOWgp]EFW15062.1 conserved hypothetical protein [Coccidioides posadasii str. Silveira]QVM09917.1 hypothetical protein D8B26_004578 [Coccidioides posadasii str. Silveira]|eukprot:XP_003070404.1 FAD dependent oxidoreductase family protein [Coccidioides posadasii C735 delta SOWgp]
MSTVIVGGGIIGVSTAYYLSDPQRSPRPKEIHIIDSSAELFASASGFAAGFIAKDWFSPEIAPLGELSFNLHRQLAEDNQGAERWGYMTSSALSLQVVGKDGQKTKRGDDWLRRGASRAEVAVRDEAAADDGVPSPLWLTEQRGGTIEKISNNGSVAQVDPLRLCQFLIRKCLERGVRVHYPAHPVAISKNGASAKLILQRLDTKGELSVPCENLILTAGAWTPRVFKTLFPKSNTRIPVGALSGYSLVFRSPRHTLEHERERYGGKCHAIFTTHPKSCGFAPEIFSRHNAEIYIAGLNSLDVPLPEVATDSHKIMEKEKSDRVKRTAVMLMGRANPGIAANLQSEADNINDLEVVREALCFRPWTESGRPIIGRIEDKQLDSNVRFPGNVFIATGHGPWGIALSLGTGKVVSDMVTGKRASADVGQLGLNAEAGLISSRL